tara:strand:- start:835 stop:1551 length:717 start_codon:yes stop_codon:yes gene_type:complete
MDQFNSSWRFVFKNFKNLVSFGLPWLIFTIISIGFISNKLPQVQIDKNLDINRLIEIYSQWYENNSLQLFIIEQTINIMFIVFIASLAVQFKNISNMGNPQSFFKVSKTIYLKIPYLFFALFITNILVQIGFLFLIFPGIYLFARLSLYPIYISLENKGPIESIKCSWNATDEFGSRLTIYTLLFGILLILIILLTASLLALSSIGIILIVPIILFETIIFSMVLSYIYFSLYKYLEK